jgi:hypothetical protein
MPRAKIVQISLRRVSVAVMCVGRVLFIRNIIRLRVRGRAILWKAVAVKRTRRRSPSLWIVRLHGALGMLLVGRSTLDIISRSWRHSVMRGLCHLRSIGGGVSDACGRLCVLGSWCSLRLVIRVVTRRLRVTIIWLWRSCLDRILWTRG